VAQTGSEKNPPIGGGPLHTEPSMHTARTEVAERKDSTKSANVVAQTSLGRLSCMKIEGQWVDITRMVWLLRLSVPALPRMPPPCASFGFEKTRTAITCVERPSHGVPMVLRALEGEPSLPALLPSILRPIFR
jgi:hypothetical protein